MKNNLLKFILLFVSLLYLNNAFAVCWPWDNCSGGDMNIVVKNDTNYTLTLNNLSNHRASSKLSFPVKILPGAQQNLAISLSGSNTKSLNASFNFNVAIAVSSDATPTLIDSIQQNIHWHWSCVSVDNAGCVYDPNHSYWEKLQGIHTWYTDPSTNLAPGFGYTISINVSSQGNNTYVYDYTVASNNPSSLPPGSQPWANTEYAPNPYQHN